MKISAALIIIYAILFFLGTIKQTDLIIQLVLDLSSWPLDNHQNYDANSTVLLSAILGGVLFGWGVLIWLLSQKIYHLAPEQTCTIVISSLIFWFIIDSIGSALSGNPYNVLANVFLLLILVGPLWFPVKEKNIAI